MKNRHVSPVPVNSPGRSQEKLKFTLIVPEQFPELLAALAKFYGQTPERYALAALHSVMLCDAEFFAKNASEILEAIPKGEL